MTFNKKITFQRDISAKDSSFTSHDWKDICKVWSNWVNVHGSEALIADSLQAQRVATVTIRYRKDIDEQCRILKDGIAYSIISIDNIRERNMLLELKVKAEVND